MSAENTITTESRNLYLNELTKEFRKRNGTKTPTEIILVCDASVLVNYGFQKMTNDIEAIIQALSAMKDPINIVGDRYELPNGWLNGDFKNTPSYSSSLIVHSEHYCTFSKILEIRTVRAEYLIAMRLVSGRRYKKDLSDIVGILLEQQKQSQPYHSKTLTAMAELYGSWVLVDNYYSSVLENALDSEELHALLAS